jgi:hypothetical protein
MFIDTLHSEVGYERIVKLLLQDGRADPAALENVALRSAANNGQLRVVLQLIADERVSINVDALLAADAGGHEAIVRRLIARDPRVLAQLCSEPLVCVAGGPLRRELDRWESRSTELLLMCVKRTLGPHVAARTADVLRDVSVEWVAFRVQEGQIEANGSDDTSGSEGSDEIDDEDLLGVIELLGGDGDDSDDELELYDPTAQGGSEYDE